MIDLDQWEREQRTLNQVAADMAIVRMRRREHDRAARRDAFSWWAEQWLRHGGLIFEPWQASALNRITGVGLEA